MNTNTTERNNGDEQRVNAATLDVIAQAIQSITELRKERAAINMEINAVIAGIESKGIDRQAFKVALKVHEMDAGEFDSFSFGLITCIKAVKEAQLELPFSDPGESEVAEEAREAL